MNAPLMGTYNHVMDAKGRMAFPNKLRDQLGLGFVITIGLEGCLYVYSSEEWAKFILKNRMDKYFHHEYDVVIGPVADDGVVLQLDLYVRHLISLEQLVKELTYKKLNKQYCFATEFAISKLLKL